MASKKAIVAFADKILQRFPPWNWDDSKEAAWADDLVGELAVFSDEAVDRGARQLIRTRKEAKTPLISECIAVVAEAKRWIDAAKNSETLPTLADTKPEATEETVWGILMKTHLAKEAARDGWIGMLVPYCFKHGRLPTDKAVIAQLKREAKAIDDWDGSNQLIAKNKILALERRQALADRVLEKEQPNA